MAGSAADRASALRPAVEAARQRVSELQARIAQLKARVHGHYTDGDPASGDAAHDELVGVQHDLGVARERLSTLTEAERVVSAEHQADMHRARLAEVEAGIEAAVTARDESLAALWPGVAVVKAAIRQARAAESAARRLDLERAELRAALEGRSTGVFHSNIERVGAVVGSSALLVAIERSAEV